MTEGPYDYEAVLPPAHGEEATWFEFCRERRLMIQRCAECGEHQFPPRSVCSGCLGASPEWVESTGRGTVFTHTTQHREAPGFEGQAPYTIALVELAEGPRILTRIVGPGAVDANPPQGRSIRPHRRGGRSRSILPVPTH